MPCYHPLKAFVIGTTEAGKRKLKVVPYGVDHLELRRYGAKTVLESESYPYVYGNSPYTIRVFKEWIQIPCGHCIGCRMEYSRDWANRMVLESLDHDSNLFITLTYNDESLVKQCEREYNTNADNISSVNRINNKSYSLNKRDFQLFMKRLRKRFSGTTIRFYACGEYGGKSLRPHYHAIIFGLSLPDLKLYKVSHDGSKLYTSEILSSLWPYGYSVVGSVNWQTCAYVARYVTKKRTGDMAKFYETFNIDPEFSLMSRKPGLARKFYDENFEQIYDVGKINLCLDGKHLSFRPPHYFDSLYDVENPENLQSIKDNLRIMAINSTQLKLSKTSLSYLEYLAVEEYNFTHKVKTLDRSDC